MAQERKIRREAAEAEKKSKQVDADKLKHDLDAIIHAIDDAIETV